MAHQHPPSRDRSGEAGPSRGEALAVAHASADDEYLVTPAGAGHEHTDTNVGIIVKFGVWLAISTVIVSIGIALMFRLFVARSEEAEPVYPLAVGQGERLPMPPRLQRFPVNEVTDFRKQEENILRSYGWIDREAGRVQIPIAEAMRLMVERGLPARAQQQDVLPPAEASALLPADSSSGRTMERRRQ